MTTVVRISSVVSVVLVAVGLCMFLAADFRHDKLPRDFKSPVMAMQMAPSMDEVEMIVGKVGHSDRSQMRSQQRLDFLFIVAHWSEFMLISALLWWHGLPGAKSLALIAGLCATLAAVLDVRENLAILQVLSAPAVQDNDAMVQTVRNAAIAKWFMVWAAVIPSALVFLGRRYDRTHHGAMDRIIFPLPGLFFLVAGIFGAIATGLEVLLVDIAPTILHVCSIALALGLIAIPAVLFRLSFRLLSKP